MYHGLLEVTLDSSFVPQTEWDGICRLFFQISECPGRENTGMD